MDLNCLLNHTTPNAPPSASPNTIAAPTPPRANTNHVAHRSEACNTGSDSRAQKPSPRTKYPKLAPAPTWALALASACTANVFSAASTGFYSTAPNPQPHAPSPPGPWARDTGVNSPLAASGSNTTQTRVLDHLDMQTFSNQSTMTEPSYQQAQTAESITKSYSPKPNNIAVVSGKPDAEATLKNENRKRKREYENEDTVSEAIGSGMDRFSGPSREQVRGMAMGCETAYGPESKKRKKGKEAGNIDGESLDGASNSATPAATNCGPAAAFLSSETLTRTGAGGSHLGDGHLVPGKVALPIKMDPTAPLAKKVKQKSGRKSRKGEKEKGVKILARTETVEKNGWAFFQRIPPDRRQVTQGADSSIVSG